MSDADKKLVDLHAPYANDGKQNGQRVSEKRTETAPAPVTLVGQGVKVLGEGEVADHRKHGNGTDVSVRQIQPPPSVLGDVPNCLGMTSLTNPPTNVHKTGRARLRSAEEIAGPAPI